MKCYYEILNVSRESSDDEIKSAYRKLALKWHPDKNLDNAEDAKEQFQLVQQAYEILSDRQERAWYDKHREQILYGSNSEFQDKSLDLFQYFTTACFKGYDDSDNSFYTIYRNVFDQIAKEDMDFCEEKSDFCEIPPFGNSTSDYESVVRPFYNYWMGYSTKKSYVWLDPYNINDIRERKLAKAVEKENKKIRQKAKKERNEEVRNLVAFVKKRDRRVISWNKLNETKKQENRKKQEEKRKQLLLEQRKINESGEQAEWTKFDNVQNDLQQIEKELNEKFGNSDSEEDSDALFCPACNKLFKNDKSFRNHELSKKHLLNVQKLKEELLADEQDIDECDSLENDDFIDKIEDENLDPVNLNYSDCSDSEQIDTFINKTVVSEKNKKAKKAKKVLKVLNLDENFTDSFSLDNTKINDSFQPFKKEDLSDEEFINDKSSKSKKKGKPKKLTVSKVTKTQSDQNSRAVDNGNIDKEDNSDSLNQKHICETCQKEYPSKNKLFQHLKSEGHSLYISKNVASQKTNKKKNK